MRFLAFIFFALAPFALQADASTADEIEIYATKVSSYRNTVNISQGVVVVYRDYILTAKRARYDKSTGILELFDDVKVSNANEYKIIGKYAKLDIKRKQRTFRPFYMLEKTSQVWLEGSIGKAKDKDIDVTKGVVSGCDPKDPLWQIEFSASDYNAKNKWLNLYNTVLYIYDIPVLYTPYFGYSLDTTRRSGLLTPSLGYSDAEGVFYEQPIYIAEQNWWDLELKPQIRSERGRGIYGSFRFVDSRVSKGSFKFGYFREYDGYYEKNDLANKEHYGLGLNYTNQDFLRSWFGYDSDAQSVIYLEASNMNDVDYINLATNDTTRNATPSQTLSRMNVFYNTDTDYIASYLKYYVDLTKENNDETLQQFPSIHYHSYLDTFLQDHFLYNFNIKSTNLYRKTGTNAIQTNVDVPLALRTSLFDEYLNIAYQTQIYGEYTYFDNDDVSPVSYENGYFLRNYNQIYLSSQLTKVYDKTVHTVDLSAVYTREGSKIRSGFYQTYRGIDCADPQNKDVCEFYDIADIQEAVTLNFSQYLYDTDGKELLYHRLSDIVAIPESGTYTIGELESELDMYLSDHVKFYNNLFFNFTYDKISKQLNRISYNGYGFRVALSHFYKKNLADPASVRTSYVTSSINYRYDAHYSYLASYDYDTVIRQKKRFQIGFLYDKRCWSFGLRYAENNRPILQNNQVASIYDRYIYFTVLLKPFMQRTASDILGLRLPEVFNGS